MDGKDRSQGPMRVPILAAGGIVLRRDPGRTTRFAVVQSARKRDSWGMRTWGLPKGKLTRGEDALAAARREAVEETGHHVTVHEFLGTLVYETATRPKVVQFWRMDASPAPRAAPMRDVSAVAWLALEDAIDRLSHLRERVFLEQVGPIALGLHRGAAVVPAGMLLLRGDDFEAEGAARIAGVPLVPAPDAADAFADEEEEDDPPAPPPRPRGKSLLRRTWGWIRHAALPQRQHFG